MALKGLVIRQPWIGKILSGEKTWELRSQPCRFRGRIALIEKGSGMVQGIATLIDDLPPLSPDKLRATAEKHGVPNAQMDYVIKMGWLRPWVLSDVIPLSQPIPYEHTSGGSWVNLTAEEEAAVLSAVSSNSTFITTQPKTAVRRSRAGEQQKNADPARKTIGYALKPAPPMSLAKQVSVGIFMASGLILGLSLIIAFFAIMTGSFAFGFKSFLIAVASAFICGIFQQASEF